MYFVSFKDLNKEMNVTMVTSVACLPSSPVESDESETITGDGARCSSSDD